MGTRAVAGPCPAAIQREIASRAIWVVTERDAVPVAAPVIPR